jgi:hypothetical protein
VFQLSIAAGRAARSVWRLQLNTGTLDERARREERHYKVTGARLAMIKYIELKTGHSDNGPAWIARVVISRSGQTIYFSDKALRRGGGQLISGNYCDISNGNEYWVSGVKKRGGDRHGGGSGSIGIEASAVAEYFEEVGVTVLPRELVVVGDFATPDPSRFVDIENATIAR